MHRGEVRVSAIDHHHRGDGAEVSLAERRREGGSCRGDGLFGELDLCFVPCLFCGEFGEWSTDADECGWVVHVFAAVGAGADSMGTSSGGGGEGEGVNVAGLLQAGDFFCD